MVNPRSIATWFKRKIKKKGIDKSKTFFEGGLVHQMNMSDFGRNREVFIAAWENDWYASSKLIFNECSEWVTHSVTTKRDYSNDYYFFLNAMIGTIGFLLKVLPKFSIMKGVPFR